MSREEEEEHGKRFTEPNNNKTFVDWKTKKTPVDSAQSVQQKDSNLAALYRIVSSASSGRLLLLLYSSVVQWRPSDFNPFNKYWKETTHNSKQRTAGEGEAVDSSSRALLSGSFIRRPQQRDIVNGTVVSSKTRKKKLLGLFYPIYIRVRLAQTTNKCNSRCRSLSKETNGSGWPAAKDLLSLHRASCCCCCCRKLSVEFVTTGLVIIVWTVCTSASDFLLLVFPFCSIPVWVVTWSNRRPRRQPSPDRHWDVAVAWCRPEN